MNIYLTLLKSTLIDLHRAGRVEYTPIVSHHHRWKIQMLMWLDRQLRRKGFAICRKNETSYAARLEGRDWPASAESMIGAKRMDAIYNQVERILNKRIPGDFIETGVWRGGACMFIKGILKSTMSNRTLWLADSFRGLPKPDGRYHADSDSRFYNSKELAVSKEDVITSFKRLGLWDGNIKILEGWFKDTLPSAPIEKIALMRLDGDMYGSTMDALYALYPNLSIGGCCMVDDYGTVEECRIAVNNFRAWQGITEQIEWIDHTGIFWIKKTELK